MAADVLTGRQKDVERYVFTMTELGWANCDMFMSEPNPISVRANLDYSSDAATFVLMPAARRSVIPYKRSQNGTWRNQRIPKGLSYYVVAYEVIDGRLVMAHKQVSAASSNIQELDYKPVGVLELKDRIKELVGSFM